MTHNNSSTTIRKKPHAVIVPLEYVKALEERQRALVHTVADGIAHAIGVSKRVLSLAEIWNRDRPDSVDHAPVESHLEEVTIGSHSNA